MSWNGFPTNIRKSIISNLKNKHLSGISKPVTEPDDTLPKIWFRVPYLGKIGESLVKTCIKKIRRNLNKPVKFIVVYQTKNVSYFLSNKDKIPDVSRNNVIYEITCPGCNKRYIGKTERCLGKRLLEHSSDFQNSAVAQHFSNCDHVNYLTNLSDLSYNLNDTCLLLSPTLPIYKNLITDNFRISYCCKNKNPNLMLLLEALFIKFNRPWLNNGLKASKQLTLFP